jgi:hypothetical protein
MSRRLYSERTNLVIIDIKDQPEEKFVALIETLGERSAVAFNKIVFSGETVVLLSSPSSLAQKEGEMIAAFPAKSNWAVVRKDQFIQMNGKEWDQHRLNDGKDRKELIEELYGKDQVVQIATFPDGNQAVIPANKEQILAYKQEIEKNRAQNEQKPSKTVLDVGQYL